MSALSLNFLGPFEAKLPSGVPVSLPTRKSECLLAYVALTPDRLHPRERLINLFWSERSDEQARNSLRHVLSALRKALSAMTPSPLQVDRTAISIGANGITVDLRTFEQLAQCSETAALCSAVELYRGEFLEGMVIRDPAAEGWLASVRDQYRRLAVEVFERLAEGQRKAGEADAAIRTSERLVALDPLRESAWRGLMRAYVDHGERNYALKAYQRCYEVLERELGVEPASETTALQTAIRDETNVLGPPVSLDESIGPAAPTTKVEDAVLLAQSPSGKPSIVVLPFVSLGAESGQDYVADGLTVDVTVNLSRYRELLVIDQGSAFAFRDSSADEEQFARQVDVEYLVKGSVQRSGDRIRISIQLVEAATGGNLWAERFEGSFGEIFAVHDEIVSKIATTLVSHIKDVSRTKAARKPPEDMTAFECVAHARPIAESMDRENNMLARHLLEEAIERDPEYAPAYAYLASTYLAELECPWCESLMDALKHGIELARKAVALDEFDSNAHATLGVALVAQKNFDLAEFHINRAIECNPNEYGAICSKAWLMAMTGRSEESIACGTVSYRLNPLQPDNCLWSFVVAHYKEHRYEEGIGALERMHSPTGVTEAWRAACLAQLGRKDEAYEAVRRAIELDGESIRTLDWQTHYPFKDERDVEHLLDGLRKAGLPE